MPSQFQLRGHSLEGLRWQLFEKYGARARIIRAERIQTGGLFGIGAVTTFEVTVEVDDRAAPGITRNAGAGLRADVPSRRAAAPRRGIGDLLADADRADDVRWPGTAGPTFAAGPDFVAGPAGVAVAPVQLRPPAQLDPAGGGVAKPDFDSILDELTRTVGEDGVADSMNAARSIPRPSQRPGDLIVLAGLREQPLHTAWNMLRAIQGGADVLTAGDHRSTGISHVFLDSVEVSRAQAVAANNGRPLLVAFSFGQRGSSNLSVLGSVRPNQLWLVVDAAHKPEDTEAWVRRACRYAVPDALAVVGATDTATPESVNSLKIPVGWVDKEQSTSTEL